ncbi:MAG: ATP synthase F1 subunit delta [Planctomycetes bacterium]|nr:ATP synthase F1 subunit delta [Planctomycetota bacterium]
MKNTVLPSRYAKAILQLAVQEGQVDEVGRQLALVSQYVLGDRELAAFWRSTKVSADDKRNALQDVLEKMDAPTLVRNTVNFLLDRGRLLFLPDITAAYARQAQELAHSVEATVTLAADMPDDIVGQLGDGLSRTFGKKVVVRTEVDPELLGGLVVRIGNTIIDGSVRGRLAAFARSLQ